MAVLLLISVIAASWGFFALMGWLDGAVQA